VPLREYLEPAASLLFEPFEFDKMRYRWRQWLYFDCNWKTAMEAFMEPYHVEGTHPQLMKYADFYAWSQALGLHGNDGYEERHQDEKELASNTNTRLGKGDARVSTAELQEEIWRTVTAATTPTFVDAAKRLVDELPAGTPTDQVMKHWLESARRDDAARGVKWPTIDPDTIAKAGNAWNVFPNMGILHGLTYALIYRVRPFGSDPNKCIFEAYSIERFPEGQEPHTEWVHQPDHSKWPAVLIQDFENMGEVQRGMRSRGFRGALLNPHQERKISNLHRNLAKFMGTGAPQPLK
jgi:phenylpropionate dioxygenase-like ring-hydroxylating dioxygenase large terminal subunit